MTESHILSSETANPIGADGGKKPLQSALIISPSQKKTNKRGTFSFLKAALLMMRPPRKNQKKKSSKQDDQQVASTGNWSKLVGSMRPLHLQENLQSPPPSLPTFSPSPSVESLEDLIPRASSSSSPSSISGGAMSQYASASNLQELDVPDDNDTDEDPDEVFDAITGDDMIDSKADLFIAQFYQQMKLQNTDSMYYR